MELNLKGQTALVTSANRGIGKAIALKFAKEGARVGITYLDGGAKETVDELRAFDPKAFALDMDQRDPSQVEQTMEEARKKLGGILNILVCNAAHTNITRARIHEIPDEELETTIQTNLLGTVRCMRNAIIHMMPLPKEENKSIIVLSSVNARAGSADYRQAMYGATKAGLEHLVGTSAWAYGQDGIRINGIAPGPTLTEALAQVPGFAEGLGKLTPMGEVSTVEDIANAAFFLAHPELSRNTTGTIMAVDGGLFHRRAMPS